MLGRHSPSRQAASGSVYEVGHVGSVDSWNSTKFLAPEKRLLGIPEFRTEPKWSEVGIRSFRIEFVCRFGIPRPLSSRFSCSDMTADQRL